MRKLGHPIPEKTLSRGSVETCKFIRAKCLIVLGQVKKEEDRLKVLINRRFREMEQALDDLDRTELAEVLRAPREELRAAAVEYGTVRIVDGALQRGSIVEAAFLVVSVGLKKGLYLIGERTIAVGDLSGVIRRKCGVIISPGELDGVIRELAALGVVEHSKKSGTVSINRDFRSDRRSPFALRNALYLLIGPVT